MYFFYNKEFIPLLHSILNALDANYISQILRVYICFCNMYWWCLRAVYREECIPSFFCRNCLFAQMFLRRKCVNTDTKIFVGNSKIIGFQLSAEILTPLWLLSSNEKVSFYFDKNDDHLHQMAPVPSGRYSVLPSLRILFQALWGIINVNWGKGWLT